MKRPILTALLCSGLISLSTGCLLVTSDGDEPLDTDGDGISDGRDNCPGTFNANQTDSDGNGIGDACEQAPDSDGDGLLDDEDNCPEIINTDQSDLDGDELGDACDQRGSFQVSWSLRQGINSDPADCPDYPNYIEVTIHNVETGDEEVEMFDCGEESVTTSEYAPGDYDIWVTLYNSETGALTALSGAIAATLEAPEILPVGPFEFSLDHGTFAFTWRILEGDLEIECADVPADKVILTSVQLSDSMSFIDDPTCELGSAGTAALPLGSYEVTLSVLSGDQTLGTSEPREAEIQFGSQVVDLGNFDLQLAPLPPPPPAP